MRPVLLCCCALLFSAADVGSVLSAGPTDDQLPLVPVGAAVTDITPDRPLRLAGYAHRRTESDGILSRLHARALAIGGTTIGGTTSGGTTDSAGTIRQPLAVLLTVDTCGLTSEFVDAVYEDISRFLPLERQRFVVSFTHTHSAPWIMSCAPLSLVNVTDAERQRLIQYERNLRDRLVNVVRAAVAARKPATLSAGFGQADFARNRRVWKDGQIVSGESADGPVDRRLPILAAHTPTGQLLAVVMNYACHATTSAGAHNRISGDWPGYAADFIEADHPGCVALVAVGCGGDINPRRSADADLSAEHGRTCAQSVRRVLAGKPQDGESGLQPVNPRLQCRLEHIDLPFGPLPSLEHWQARTRLPGIDGALARRMVAKAERDGHLPTAVENYPVQTWVFGDDLAVVFLGGEVVIDYTLRLNSMFDADRLWVCGCSNDLPCYIPSKRVLREGGYEAESSMKYFGLPGRLSPETEDRICWTVQKLLPHRFYSEKLLQDYPGPKPPEDALASFVTHPRFQVELVASEPLIQDPVAFDWDIRGRLWVVEMGDYPNADTGGRVRVLTDDDGDGRYDSAVTFLQGPAWPTGLCVWRDGVIITAAPDVIYAEDTDDDGICDRQTVLLTGFSEGNQQHRINGLRWGLDGWLYLANGDSGGKVRVVSRTGPQGPEPMDHTENPDGIGIRFRDLRFHPDSGRLETVAGQTQFCRERDDFGQWFGNNNSNPIWHYVMESRYAERNPFARIGSLRAQVSSEPGAARVYPVSRTVARFNDFFSVNRFTSACGTAIYRDTLPGSGWYGNALTCEPVHNLVSRLVLTRCGVTFCGKRAPEEAASEFLASSDNWFRPTMVRTGPDGAIYVCDMYRQVIEHPQWIPASAQMRLDLRAGCSMGRIYRIRPADSSTWKSRAGWSVADGRSVPLTELAARIGSPNGWQRDTAQRLLQHRQDEWTDAVTNALPWTSDLPAVRLQAVCTAAMTGHLSVSRLLTALRDPDARVRRRAIPLLEDIPIPEEQLAAVLEERAADPDVGVRLQLACTLGRVSTEQAGELLGRILLQDPKNEWIRRAVLSSLTADTVIDVLQSVGRRPDPDRELTALLMDQARRFERTADIRDSIQQILHRVAHEKRPSAAEMRLAADMIRMVRRTKILQSDSATAEVVSATGRQAEMLLDDADPNRTAAALEVFAALENLPDSLRNRVLDLTGSVHPPLLQEAALKALVSVGAVRTVLNRWSELSPERRRQIQELAVERESSAADLLDGIESGLLSGSDLDAVCRERLFTHPNAAVQQRAQQVLKFSSQTQRQQLVREWTARVQRLSGDPSDGAAVFRRRCAVCHRLENTGQQIGADLSNLRDRSVSTLVTAILDPNRAVESRFLSYTAVLADGRTVSGLVQNETETSLTIVGSDGKTRELLRADLEQLLASGRSFMPEGFERDLTEQDLADVIAFVQAADTPWKRFAGNLPRRISAEDNVLILPVAAAEFYGPNIVYRADTDSAVRWTSSEDRLVWQIRPDGWGHWDVEFDYVCPDAHAGGRLKLATQARQMSASVPGTGTPGVRRRWKAGSLELSPGLLTLTLSPDGDPEFPLFELHSVRLTRQKR